MRCQMPYAVDFAFRSWEDPEVDVWMAARAGAGSGRHDRRPVGRSK